MFIVFLFFFFFFQAEDGIRDADVTGVQTCALPISLVGGEESIGDVDGDRLLLLSRQAIQEEGEIETTALGAHLLRVGLEGCELVLEEEVGFIEEAANQGAFAVVDAPAGDEAEEPRALLGLQVLLDIHDEIPGGLPRPGGDSGHQKYPSCFFFSIDAVASKPMTRPCRSDLFVNSISRMTALTVSAVDSMAPVRG